MNNWPPGWDIAVSARVNQVLLRLSRAAPQGKKTHTFERARKLTISRVRDLFGGDVPTESQLLTIVLTINPSEV